MNIGFIGDASTIAPDCMAGDQLTQDAAGNFLCIAPQPTSIGGGNLNLSIPTILIPIGLLVVFAIMGAKR